MDPKELQTLLKIFESARRRVLDKIANTGGAGTKTYYNTIRQQLEAELQRMQAASGQIADLTIPQEYAAGLQAVYDYFQSNHLQMTAPDMFASIHMDAIHEMSRELQHHLQEGITQAVSRTDQALLASAREVQKRLGLMSGIEKVAGGMTVRDMKNILQEHLEDHGFMSVTYGSGDGAYEVPIDSYAEMCSRTIPMQAGNQARENQLTDNGYDLVEMTEHWPTCPICAGLQGRVYSISGNDKRFPPLSMAFKGGYHGVHPNCSHVVVPWIESLQTPEEIQQAIDRSGAPVEDTRTKQQMDAYNAEQAKNRQARQDQYQYDRYRQALGDAAPKSYSAFRRLKSDGGRSWGVLEAQYRGMGYYNKAVKLEPEVTKTVLATADKVGMSPAGLEYRIKGKESYLRKIKSNYSPKGNTYEVKDILRYTYTANADEMAAKTLRSIDEFSSGGYTTIEIRNSWMNPRNPYKGVNTTMQAPNGQMFEMQYHTPESFELKNGEMHRLYEKARLIEDRRSPEYIDLMNQMFDLSEGLTVPTGIESVKNR